MKNNNELIDEIQELLNRYSDIAPTSINPELLAYMDRGTLLSIIDSILRQHESTNESNKEWLEQFKKY